MKIDIYKIHKLKVVGTAKLENIRDFSIIIDRCQFRISVAEREIVDSLRSLTT